MKTVKTIPNLPANFFLASLRADNALDGAYQIMILAGEAMYLHNHRFNHYEAVVDGNGHTLPLDVKDRAEERIIELMHKISKHLLEGGKLDSRYWDATDMSVIRVHAYGTDGYTLVDFI